MDGSSLDCFVDGGKDSLVSALHLVATMALGQTPDKDPVRDGDCNFVFRVGENGPKARVTLLPRKWPWQLTTKVEATTFLR